LPFFGERLVMIPDRDLGAGTDKTLGDGAPKPLRAAGDDGAAAVQIDLVHGAESFIPISNDLTKPAKPPPMAGRKKEVLQLRE